MITMTPPCKRMKCLKYPSCISREVVECDILRAWYETLMNDNKKLANRASKTWGTLRMILPNLLTIKGKMRKDKFGQNTMKHHTYPLNEFTEDMLWKTRSKPR